MKKVLIVFNHPAPYKVALFNELSKYFDLTVIFERSKERDRSKAFYFEKEYAFKTVSIKGIPFINILVDHPFCYLQALTNAPKNCRTTSQILHCVTSD